MAFFSDFRGILISVSYEKPIDDLEDLLASGKTLYLMKGTSMERFFASSPLQLHQTIYKNLHTNRNSSLILLNGWMAPDIEKKVVIDKEGVVIASKENIQMQHFDSISKFGYDPWRRSKLVVFSTKAGFIVSKGSPLKMAFDPIIRQIKAMGIIQKITKVTNKIFYLCTKA
jgi:hypothetical protein